MADSESSAPEPEVQPKTAPLEQRVGAIEQEQQRQGGILDRIEQALAGSPKATSTSSPDTPSGTPSVAEQVRKGVEEIEARKAKEAADQAAKDGAEARLKNIEDRLPERKPSEPATGRKTRLQERLFGKADAR